MTSKDEPFVIPCAVPAFDNPLEYDLFNLKLRLEIQKGWVEETERQIKDLEERIKNGLQR